MINEDFLHFIWKFQLFNFLELKGTVGQAIRIKKSGLHNLNAGPDFLNAQVYIDDMLWCGHVEIHVKSSDWYAHNHHKDANYDTVVLHVVYSDDKPLVRSDGQVIPTLVLKDKIPDKYLNRYDALYHSIANIPCAYALPTLSEEFWEAYADRLIVERLEDKMASIHTLFVEANSDYQETFYQLLAYALGLKINALQMLDLAKSCPLKLLKKKSDKREVVEALLYGQAGLLARKFKDQEVLNWQKHHQFYQKKYLLEPINANNWKFFRLRPASFPTLRISLLADFVVQEKDVFEQIINFVSVNNVRACFNLKGSNYWNYHYVFDKKVARHNCSIGKSTFDILLINAVLPFAFFYARKKGDEEKMQRILNAYRDIKAEDNRVIKMYKESKVPVKTALMSQALIHLNRHYCIERKCLNCRVANKILKD